MKSRNYSYVRPDELSIPLSAGARERIGITDWDELELAKKFANASQHLEAMDLLRSLLLKDPNNKSAQRLLAKIEKEFRGSGILLNTVVFARNRKLGAILPESVKRPIRKLIQAKKF